MKPTVTLEKPSESSPAKHPKKGKVQKVRKGKSPLKLIDKDEEVHHEPERQGEGVDYDQMSLETFQAHCQAPIGGVAICEPIAEATRQLPVVEGKGKAIATDEQAAQSLLDLHKPKKTNAETCAIIDKTNSEGDTEILHIGEEQGEDVAYKSRPPPKRVLIEEDQAGPNPRQSHVALAGLDPEPMHNDFGTSMYPQVHESLKHPDKEHAQVENLLSSTGTLSSMKNLDANTFDDKFFNDKPTKKEPDKTNMETKFKSMVTILIHQASSSIPLLSTPVIDLTPSKLVSPTIQEQVFTATTTTTTTLSLLPPPQQQSITDSSLAF
nr:hypothetical protein [Tanacetum cinerariifolium]